MKLKTKASTFLIIFLLLSSTFLIFSAQVKADWSTAGNNSQRTASIDDSASDGYSLQQNWNLSVTGNSFGQCAIDSQGILYAATSSYLYAINLTTGIVIWSSCRKL